MAGRWSVADDDEVVVSTARATIRPWRTSEADVLFDIRRRPEVSRWLGDPEPWADLDTAHERMAVWREQATPAVPSSSP